MITDVALLVVSAILASEIFMRLPLMDQVTLIVGTARRSAATVRSRRISDHWKETVLPAYSVRLAGRSFYFFLLLCLAAAAGGARWPRRAGRDGALAGVADAALCDRDHVRLLNFVHFRANTSRAWLTILRSTNFCTVWRWGRGCGPRCCTTWNAALSSSPPRPTTADMCSSAALPGQGRRSSCARFMGRVNSGSLTYADMPFVLAPNLWQRLSANGGEAGPKAERAHGDGIAVDFHSPEALDEVYWRIFSGGDYILADRLVPHVPDDELVAGYRDLMRLVLRRTGRSRYLSKNNNHLLRLESLARAFRIR